MPNSHVDAAYSATMREALAHFHEEVAHFLADYGHEPSADSQAEAEHRSASHV